MYRLDYYKIVWIRIFPRPWSTWAYLIKIARRSEFFSGSIKKNVEEEPHTYYGWPKINEMWPTLEPPFSKLSSFSSQIITILNIHTKIEEFVNIYIFHELRLLINYLQFPICERSHLNLNEKGRFYCFAYDKLYIDGTNKL